jgi:hypothetical protein
MIDETPTNFLADPLTHTSTTENAGETLNLHIKIAGKHRLLDKYN